MTLCQRHGQSGVFVVEDGRLAGGVSREDLDKAVGHGLSHAPVRGIMSRHVVTAGRTRRSRAALARHDGRGRSRRRPPRRRARRRREPRRSPSCARGRRASPRRADRLHRRPTSGGYGTRADPGRGGALGHKADGVYLVGGTVRDILLGEQSFDVDIAVEGDAIAFGYALAETLGGRATPHRKFGTAVITYGDGEHVDVVTTRTEFYDSPVRCRPSSARGCARICSGATSRSTRWPRLSASTTSDGWSTRTAAEEISRARVLRVLHNLSFIDDPTRIFRGIRYEARYGFRFDEHSAGLLRSCIEIGLVGDLSSSRLGTSSSRSSRTRLRRTGFAVWGSWAPIARSIRSFAETTRLPCSSNGCSSCATSSRPRCRSGGSGSPPSPAT